MLVGDRLCTSHGPGQPSRDVERRPNTMPTLTFCTSTCALQYLVTIAVAFRPRKLAQSLRRDVGAWYFCVMSRCMSTAQARAKCGHNFCGALHGGLFPVSFA